MESLCCLPCARAFHHFLNLLFCLHMKCKNYQTLVGTDVLLQTYTCSGDFLLVFKMTLLFSKRTAYVFKFGFWEYTEYFEFVYISLYHPYLESLFLPVCLF